MNNQDMPNLKFKERKFELVYIGLCVKIKEDYHAADFYCREAREELKNIDEKGKYRGKYHEGLLRRIGYVNSDFFHSHNLRSQGNLAPEFNMFGDSERQESLYTKVKNEMFILSSEEFLHLGKPMALIERKIYSPTETGGNYA